MSLKGYPGYDLNDDYSGYNISKLLQSIGLDDKTKTAEADPSTTLGLLQDPPVPSGAPAIATGKGLSVDNLLNDDTVAGLKRIMELGQLPDSVVKSIGAVGNAVKTPDSIIEILKMLPNANVFKPELYGDLMRRASENNAPGTVGMGATAAGSIKTPSVVVPAAAVANAPPVAGTSKPAGTQPASAAKGAQVNWAIFDDAIKQGKSIDEALVLAGGQSQGTVSEGPAYATTDPTATATAPGTAPTGTPASTTETDDTPRSPGYLLSRALSEEVKKYLPGANIDLPDDTTFTELRQALMDEHDSKKAYVDKLKSVFGEADTLRNEKYKPNGKAWMGLVAAFAMPKRAGAAFISSYLKANQQQWATTREAKLASLEDQLKVAKAELDLKGDEVQIKSSLYTMQQNAISNLGSLVTTLRQVNEPKIKAQALYAFEDWQSYVRQNGDAPDNVTEFVKDSLKKHGIADPNELELATTQAFDYISTTGPGIITSVDKAMMTAQSKIHSFDSTPNIKGYITPEVADDAAQVDASAAEKAYLDIVGLMKKGNISANISQKFFQDFRGADADTRNLFVKGLTPVSMRRLTMALADNKNSRPELLNSFVKELTPDAEKQAKLTEMFSNLYKESETIFGQVRPLVEKALNPITSKVEARKASLLSSTSGFLGTIASTPELAQFVRPELLEAYAKDPEGFSTYVASSLIQRKTTMPTKQVIMNFLFGPNLQALSQWTAQPNIQKFTDALGEGLKSLDKGVANTQVLLNSVEPALRNFEVQLQQDLVSQLGAGDKEAYDPAPATSMVRGWRGGFGTGTNTGSTVLYTFFAHDVTERLASSVYSFQDSMAQSKKKYGELDSQFTISTNPYWGGSGNISKDGITPSMRAIMNEEGFRSKPYKDTQGYWTIGLGHKIRDGETFTTISEQEAIELFKNDYNNAVQIAQSFPEYAGLPEAGKEVMVDMIYNMGIGWEKTKDKNGKGYKSFKTFRQQLLKGDYLGASQSILESDYARNQVPNRAKRNSAVLASLAGAPTVAKTTTSAPISIKDELTGYITTNRKQFDNILKSEGDRKREQLMAFFASFRTAGGAPLKEAAIQRLVDTYL